MFNFKNHQNKNVLEVCVEGFIRQEEGNKFIEEYKNAVNKLNPSQYSLLLDGESLATSSPDMIPVLKSCLKMYKDSDFKEVILIKSKSITANMQTKALAREVGLELKIIDNRDEVTL